MKKILLPFVCLLFLAFRCSDDDDDVEHHFAKYKTNIVGKWMISDYSSGSVKNLAELDKFEPCSSKGLKTFNSDDSVLETYFFGKDCNENSANLKGYKLHRNTVTITEKGGGKEQATDYVTKYDIIELNSSKLVIKGYYVDEGIKGQDPLLNEEEYFTYTYKKIK